MVDNISAFKREKAAARDAALVYQGATQAQVATHQSEQMTGAERHSFADSGASQSGRELL